MKDEQFKKLYARIRKEHPKALIFGKGYAAQIIILSEDDFEYAIGRGCNILTIRQTKNDCLTMEYINDYFAGRDKHGLSMEMTFFTKGWWDFPKDHPFKKPFSTKKRTITFKEAVG